MRTGRAQVYHAVLEIRRTTTAARIPAFGPATRPAAAEAHETHHPPIRMLPQRPHTPHHPVRRPPPPLQFRPASACGRPNAMHVDPLLLPAACCPCKRFQCFPSARVSSSVCWLSCSPAGIITAAAARPLRSVGVWIPWLNCIGPCFLVNPASVPCVVVVSAAAAWPVGLSAAGRGAMARRDTWHTHTGSGFAGSFHGRAAERIIDKVVALRPRFSHMSASAKVLCELPRFAMAGPAISGVGSALLAVCPTRTPSAVPSLREVL